MENNDILRRLRYTFDFNDDKMIALFAEAGLTVTRAQVSDWLKQDDDPAFMGMNDKWLAIFLNGLINDKRGKREGPQPEPEKHLNNNTILRKLKIALNLKDNDMIELFALADMRVSKPELSAFFRKPGHKHYRMLNDQYLRRFMQGVQAKYRP